MLLFSRSAQKFFSLPPAPAVCLLPLPPALPRHDQLRRREHRGHAAVLPAAEGAAHAALAGRPLLRARAADIDDLSGVCRSLVLSPVGAVSGFWFRRRALASPSIVRTLLHAARGRRHCVQRPALDQERRRTRPSRTSEQEARAGECGGERKRSQNSLASEAAVARRAEAAARPRAPARSRDALAALAAETRPVHRGSPFPVRTRAGSASFRR